MDDKNNQDDIDRNLDAVREQTDKVIDSKSNPEQERKTKKQGKNFEEELHKEHIKDREQDRKLKKEYGDKAFWFVCIWSGLFWIVLLFNNYFIHLPDNVLKYLVIIIPVQVIGIIYLIIKGLFK